MKNQNLSKRLTEVTEDLQGCKLNGSAIVYSDSEEEVGLVVGVGSVDDEADNVAIMPDDNQNTPPADPLPARYQSEDKADGEDYFKRVGLIKLEWDPDVHFWFNSIEAALKRAQVFR